MPIPQMIRKSVLFIFLLLIQNPFWAQEEGEDKMEYFILNNQLDSAKNVLKKLDSPKRDLYKRLINDKYTTDDVIEFVGSLGSDIQRQFETVKQFVENRVSEPKSKQEVDLSYIRALWHYTNLVRNEYSLEEASKINNRNKAYLKSIVNKKSIDYQKATIYLNTHDFIMSIIQKKTKEAERIIEHDLKLAKSLNDTFLILTTRYYKAELLTSKRDLNSFIPFQRKTIEMENSLLARSDYFTLTVESLVEALLFSGDFDQIEIETYLEMLLKDPGSTFHSLPLYAKYIGHLPPNSPARQRVFALFKVKNESEFADKLIQVAGIKVNKHELSQLYNEVAYMLRANGFSDKAFEILEMEMNLTKEIYSNDLAKAIADYENQKVIEKQEQVLEKEKQKEKYYLTITMIIFFSLIFTVLLLVRNRKVSNKLAIQNKEKEVLLREIHHRVKNNFQTISSLLDFQMKGIEDEKAVSRIKEGQSRLKSMSLIHEKLYQNQDDVATVDLREYTEQLTQQVLGIYGLNDVSIRINIGRIELDIDTAIPVGLILNEIITNSCKYSFQNGEGELWIDAISLSKGQYKLVIKDNGPGLPTGFQVSKLKSLGMKLITRLAKQLHGNVQFASEEGTKIEVHFKDTFERKQTD